MSFFNIVARDKEHLNNISKPVSLKVIMENGVVTTPDISINVSDLSKGYSHFYNTSGDGISFKISVIIDEDEKVGNTPLIKWLDNHIRNLTPFYITTDAVDIKNFVNKPFVIIKNDNRTQKYLKYSIWELEFKTYNQLNVFHFANNNAGIKEALWLASGGTPRYKLKKCGYKNLVYSKKKKYVKCVKYMQEILYKKKFLKKKYVNGWFGKHTKTAVKNFQKDYNKKHVKAKTINGVIKKGSMVKANKKTKGSTIVKIYGINKVLPTNGKVDKLTWQALCK